jgi:hypothetical protein
MNRTMSKRKELGESFTPDIFEDEVGASEHEWAGYAALISLGLSIVLAVAGIVIWVSSAK